MKATRVAHALLLACAASGAVQASTTEGADVGGCNVHSDYSISTYKQAFVFKKQDGTPVEMGLGGGRLFIDGREATLSEADHRRLRQMEAEMHALVPEVRRVAGEAVEIAFAALTEVARGLATDPDATVASLEQARLRLRAEIANQPLTPFADKAVEDIVEPIVTEFVPQIVGGAVSSALKSVFSGRAASDFEARMKRMEHELDERVESRAKALEPLALAMCRRLHRIDALDDAIDYRLPGGQALQLLRVDRDAKH